MGFYIRKSLSFGPLRFNLSTFGVGVSAGVKGFRVGTGPRGIYVHAGRGGLYYRATLPNGPSRRRASAPSPVPQPERTAGPLTDIESADVLSMVDVNSAGLVAELNEKHKMARFWPIVLTLGMLVLGAGMLVSHAGLLTSGVMIGFLAVPAAYWDARRKTTVLFYDLETPVLPAVENLHAAFDSLRACARTWHIEAEGSSIDLKYTAGANTTIRRNAVRLTVSTPRYFKTNVPILSIPVGRQRLFLLPDRLLVYDSHGVGAVAYEALQFSVSQTQFVEGEGVPNDARVVNRTWRYVNKSGGPDRRFRENPELPIVLYEELSIRSSSGLNERLHFSRVGASTPFIAAVQQLASVLRASQIATESSEAHPSTAPLTFSDELLQPPFAVTVPETNSTVRMPPVSVDRKYFFFTSSVQGPFSPEELAEFHRSGRITSETPICSEDDNRWTPFKQFFPDRANPDN